jgi:hypothetical protein
VFLLFSKLKLNLTVLRKTSTLCPQHFFKKMLWSEDKFFSDPQQTLKVWETLLLTVIDANFYLKHPKR